MAMTNPVKRLTRRRPGSVTGPVVVFSATVVVTLAILAIAPSTMPPDAVMPVVSSTFFLFAVIVALAAWQFGQADRQAISYWDVAGALTLFGIFSGILTEPDQLVRLIEVRHETR